MEKLLQVVIVFILVGALITGAMAIAGAVVASKISKDE